MRLAPPAQRLLLCGSRSHSPRHTPAPARPPTPGLSAPSSAPPARIAADRASRPSSLAAGLTAALGGGHGVRTWTIRPAVIPRRGRREARGRDGPGDCEEAKPAPPRTPPDPALVKPPRRDRARLAPSFTRLARVSAPPPCSSHEASSLALNRQSSGGPRRADRSGQSPRSHPMCCYCPCNTSYRRVWTLKCNLEAAGGTARRAARWRGRSRGSNLCSPLGTTGRVPHSAVLRVSPRRFALSSPSSAAPRRPWQAGQSTSRGADEHRHRPRTYGVWQHNKYMRSLNQTAPAAQSGGDGAARRDGAAGSISDTQVNGMGLGGCVRASCAEPQSEKPLASR